MTQAPLSTAEFEAALRAKGAYYHIYHPYQVAMYEGRATREQIQGWVANRYYYQVNIPLKDAAILANCPDREVRREWIQRMIDHDGAPGEDGGIEAWLRLGQAVGLDPDQLRSQELVLPGVRFAVDAYVNFAPRLNKLLAPTIANLFQSFNAIGHKRRAHHQYFLHALLGQRIQACLGIGFDPLRASQTGLERD